MRSSTPCPHPVQARSSEELKMAKVVAQAMMSLDGYVAKQDNTIGRLFDWLQNGDVAVPTPAADFHVHLTPEGAEHWRAWVLSIGALVCGRTPTLLPILTGLTEGGRRPGARRDIAVSGEFPGSSDRGLRTCLANRSSLAELSGRPPSRWATHTGRAC